MTVASNFPRTGEVINSFGTGFTLSAAGVLAYTDLIEYATFASASKTFSGLTGDTDLGYIIRYGFKCTASGINSVEFKPNGATTSQSSQWHEVNGAPASSVSQNTTRIIGAYAGNSERVNGEFVFLSRRGNGGRAAFFHYHTMTGTRAIRGSGRWSEDATELTSIEILPAADFDTGSWAAIYRIRGA